MSDSQAYEEVTVSSDGVTVVKRFEEDEFPVPAIAFEFSTDREEDVSVRLSDTVPDDVEVEDLGFHPEYGSEFWTIDDETITFERDFEANASYTTVYGIRATGSDDVEQFLTEPTIDDVTPPLPEEEKEDRAVDDEDKTDDEIVPESGDDVVKEAIAGEGEIPGLEDEDDDEGADGDDVTLELNDPNEPDTAAADDGSGSPDSADSGGASVPSDGVVSAIADEIRQNNVSKDDLKLLYRAFEVVADDSGSGGGATDARIQQIQDDISDLRAYTSALEEFLEENGTGEQLIADFEQQLDDFEQQLGDMQDDLDNNSEQLSSVSTDVEDIGDEVDSVTNEIAGVSSNVSSLDEEIDGLQGSIDDIESTVEELEEQVTDGDVGDRIDEIEAEIQDLQEWQEQIKSTFG